MPETPNVPAQLAKALVDFHERPALVDGLATLSYGQLADIIARLKPHFPTDSPVAVFGKPSTSFGAAVTACVVLGRPFVHLDPAMPLDVLTNIILELGVEVVLLAQLPDAGQLPAHCTCVDVTGLMDNLHDGPPEPVRAAKVAPDDAIYIVATSGTTGKPKCIPVTQQSAYLSYAWRDAYTPYDTTHMVGAYIFAIWEMFRPLRNGAAVCFPRFSELMNPKALLAFWQRYHVTEMLFTPSALEKTLQALPANEIKDLKLQRVILNGEVVSNELIAAVKEKLPGVTLWNLYSICETHDIAMTDVTDRPSTGGPVSVGVPMEHLRAVVLDENDQLCPTGQPGLVHFEGRRMLGPGYVNRPEETALRFREISLEGRAVRLYDTGDQGFVGADGAVYIMGRIAHMLKLRGHSIQTNELMESLRSYIRFGKAIPWIQNIEGQGNALVFYYQSDAAQSAQNAQAWGLSSGENRMPAALSKALRSELPSYCVPSFLVQLDEIPINAVSGKCDYKRLPRITSDMGTAPDMTDALPTVAQSAKIMGCPVADIDPDLSFHDQGGDSLMAVNLLLALEEVYGCRVDFDFALNVPLARLHEILTTTLDVPAVHSEFTRKGILVTGATGFLGSRVLASAARQLPQDEVIYCVIREKRRAPTDRLLNVAAAQGVDPSRLVLITASIDDSRFGLDGASYRSLANCVTSVIHCAAMVNLAVDAAHMEVWSQAGIANILQFCRDAEADLRFSSSSAVFPDSGGPYPENAPTPFAGCSGYGAAKIDAERQIAASGVSAAVVRLPSLYDIDAPNPNDIYEIIMAACDRMKAVPTGFSFRMIDVHAAADALVGFVGQAGITYYNLTPEIYVTPDMIPDNFAVLPVDKWLHDAPLSESERLLIASDTSVLRALSRLDHAAARGAWEQITDRPFAQITDPSGLAKRRFARSAEQAA